MHLVKPPLDGEQTAMAIEVVERLTDRLKLRPHINQSEVQILRDEVLELCRTIRQDQARKTRRLHGGA